MTEAFDPVPPAPDSLTELASATKGGRRRIKLVLFVLVPLVLIGAGGAWWQLAEQAARRELEQAWRSVGGCLLGSPLGPKERPSLRVRRLQLEAVATERNPDAASWPGRCADSVAALFETLRRSHASTGREGELATLSESFAVQLRKAGQMADLSARVDALFETAGRLGLGTTDLSVPADPPPALRETLDLDTLPPTALLSPLGYALDSLATEPFVGPELHLLLHDARLDPKPTLCTFTARGPEAVCRKIGGALAGKEALTLAGTPDPGALSLVFAGKDGEDGIFRADSGALVAAMRARSAYVAKDGYVAIASELRDRATGEFELVEQRRPGGPLERAVIGIEGLAPAATQIHRYQVLWNKLVILSYDDASGKPPRLQYRELPTTGTFGRFVDVDALNWLNASIEGCRSEETLTLRVGGHEGYLAFFSAGRWSTPLRATDLGGTMSCDGAEGIFTNGGSQLRCTAAGCKPTEGRAPKFEPFKIKDGELCDLGGKVLAVGTTEDDGGVRFRHSEPRLLDERGKDALLFDDHVRAGTYQLQSTLLGMHLYTRGRFAVLAMSTPAGVYALYFDAHGKPWPARISWTAGG
jgi:hypothetical protein